VGDHLGELDLGEAEPSVVVEFASFFEAVLKEVEDDEAATGFEDSVGLGEGFGGLFGVMEGLGEDGEVDGVVIDGDGLDVAEAVFEVGELVFRGELLPELDHFFGVINGDDFFGALGNELGKGSFSGSEVGNGVVVEDLEHGFGEALPRAAGNVFAAEFPGEIIEVSADLVFALPDDVAQGGVVFFHFGKLSASVFDNGDEFARNLSRVDVVFSRALIGDELLFFKLGELGRDPGLSHAKDLLELCDGE